MWNPRLCQLTWGFGLIVLWLGGLTGKRLRSLSRGYIVSKAMKKLLRMGNRWNVMLHTNITSQLVTKCLFNSTAWLFLPGHDRLIFEIALQKEEKISLRLHISWKFQSVCNGQTDRGLQIYIETESKQLWLALKKLEQQSEKLTNRSLIFKKATSGKTSFQYMMSKTVLFDFPVR